MHEITLLKQIARDIAKTQGRLFFVGGYPRDLYLKKTTKDFDVECFHISLSNLETILARYGRINTVGKHFGILKLEQYPTIDFALPRTEQKIGEKHTDFAIHISPDIPYHLAAKRRDFTCNSIMIDVLTDEVLDFYNGRKDIAHKIIRHIDNQTFVEDALRALRACQFASRFQFSIADETLTLIKHLPLHHLSDERIQIEMKKGLELSPCPHQFIHNLIETGIAAKLFPNLTLISQHQKKQLFIFIDALKNTMPANQFFLYALAFLFFFTPLNSDSQKYFLQKQTERKKIQHIKYTLKLFQTIRTTPSFHFFILFCRATLENQLFFQLIWTHFPTYHAESLLTYDNFLKLWKLNEKKIEQNNITGADLLPFRFSQPKAFKYYLFIARYKQLLGLNQSEILTYLHTLHQQGKQTIH